MIHVIRRLALWMFVLSAVACSSLTDPRKDYTVEQFYNEAKQQLNQGNYEEAVKIYEQLQGRFPYGRYAEQAQLEAAYANYKFGETALALAACDRFIRQYPTHPNVDYAYYLKGVVSFHDTRPFSEWLFRVKDDLNDRDPRSARESYDSFRELVQRFPTSRYAEDARLRMAYLFEAQARYEVGVADYYYRRGAYVAAVNRAKHTLENYPRTPATEGALGIQTMAYKKMGLNTLYEDSLRILSRNFPESPYLKRIEDLNKS